jgi:hypothetical protein
MRYAHQVFHLTEVKAYKSGMVAICYEVRD